LAVVRPDDDRVMVMAADDPSAASDDPPPDQPAVALRDVSKRYRVGEATVTALDAVDLTIGAGELVVILGPSGSGKSTLLNMVGALDVPTEGTVVVAGRDLTAASRSERFAIRRRTVAFIFQTFNLFPSLTARENVRFGADVTHVDDAPAATDTALRLVGLADRADHFPHQLSGGEQQRVAIARALATGNPVLLADEPTGELDFATSIQILGLLREQVGAGRTVLVVTHNREIARLADRVVELSSGRLVGDGPPPGGPVPVAELRW
jgi:putative ABC transport system ATP-binding protein